MRPLNGLSGIYWWFARHPRVFVLLVMGSIAYGIFYGGYLFWELQSTRKRLAETESRLEQQESRSGESAARVEEALGRIEVAERQLRDAIADLTRKQEEANRATEAEFAERLAQARREGAERLSQLSEADAEGRRRLERETEARLAKLKDELSREMVQGYTDFKAREEELVRSLAARIQSGELASEAFKRVFQEARDAVLFLRVDYQVHVPRADEVRDLTVFGSGFLLSPEGIAVTSQHVMAPWRYDRQLTILRALGMAELLPESVKISAWTVGTRVEDPDGKEPPVHWENAFRTGQARNGLRVLFMAEPETEEQTALTPLGEIHIRLPQVGRTDIAVFQLIDFSRRFPTLHLARVPPSTLDEVLAIGYPFSSLQRGVAVPQASRGRVRRIGQDFVELDSPFHPGNSGGPILNQRGELIGMAGAVIGSPVYGMAVLAQDLARAMKDAQEAVRRDQERLQSIGCDPGPADGHIGARTLRAYECERAKQARN